jgi:hypothetical protein
MEAKMKKPNTEDLLKLLIVVVVILFLGMLAAWICAPHTVQSYYLDRQISGTGSCVVASIDWDSDSVVFCSDDINKVMDALTRANASLGRR